MIHQEPTHKEPIAASFILAIVGIITTPFIPILGNIIFGILGIVWSNKSEEKLKRFNGAGAVLSYINIVLAVLAVTVLYLFIWALSRMSF